MTATTRFLPVRARVWLGPGSSFSDLQWFVDAYALTLAAFLLTAGSLSDMYGRRRLFLIGLAVFTGASLLGGFATSTLMLQVFRAVQGAGGGIIFSVSLALLAGAFRGKDRGVAFGVWGAITGIAVAVGPLLGGVLTSGISWRRIFFVNGPVGAVAIVLSVLKVTGVDKTQHGHGDGSCMAGAGKPCSETAGSRTARPTRSSPGAATRAHPGLSWAVAVPNVDARTPRITSTGMRGTSGGPG